MDFLKKVITSVSSSSGISAEFPYQIDDTASEKSEDFGPSRIWTIQKGHHIKDKRKVTVFVSNIANNPRDSPYARNALKRLKGLRHPNIIRVHEGIEIDGMIYIATEEIVPFSAKYKPGPLVYDELMQWAVLNLVTVLQFLHQEATLIHGNIGVSSLFVTPAGEVKLGGFEVATSVLEPETLITSSHSNSQLPEAFRSWDKIRSGPIYSLDAYMFSALLKKLFVSTPGVLQNYCQCINGRDILALRSPASLLEPAISQILFPKTHYIAAEDCFREIPTSVPQERERLFSSLRSLLIDLNSDYVLFKLVPQSISLLEIQASLEGIRLLIDVYKGTDDEMGPCKFLLNLFGSSDRAIRLLLLDALGNHLVDKLGPKKIQESVFPQIINGLSDVMPELREQTLKSCTLIATHLTARQVNHELITGFLRLQNDEQPGIRVNAIICLAKIVPFLEPKAQQKHLVTGISRALQDPFPPARLAGLRVLKVKASSISIDTLARQFIPVIGPLLVYNDNDTSILAMETMGVIVDHIKAKLSGETTSIPNNSSAGQEANVAPPREVVSEEPKTAQFLTKPIGSNDEKKAPNEHGPVQSSPNPVQVQVQGNGWGDDLLDIDDPWA